jgi:copper homeostasis protein
MPLLLEVIVTSLADARAAAEGGADRLEIVRDLQAGGLTPPVELVRAIAGATRLPLRVMLRENDGYGLRPGELEPLRRAAAQFAELGVDGVVVGFASAGEPRLDDVARVLEAAPGVRATFHRAFDQLRDPVAAIGRIAALEQIDRILTSGGSGTPGERADRLAEYSARAAGRFDIVAGYAVDEAMLIEIVRTGCVREAHVGRAVREHDRQDAPVSGDRVRRLVRIGGSGVWRPARA